MDWIVENWELIAGLIIPICALASALIPDGHWSMKIVNAIALNVGKAANDPQKQ